MVETLSLNVSVPSINVEHNFIVPVDMSVEVAINLMLQTLSEEYPGVHKSSLNANNLIQKKSGKFLTSGCSFKQLCIMQGDDLVLV